MPPRFIQYEGKIYMLDVGGKKRSVLAVALAGNHDGLIVRFGRTHCFYTAVPQPQTISYGQIEESIFKRGAPIP